MGQSVILIVVVAILGCSLAAPAQAEPPIPAPAVTVRGILQSGRGNFALLTTPNQAYVVKEGDKLGDYNVAKIGGHKVTFGYQQLTFPLPMASGGSIAKTAPKSANTSLSKSLVDKSSFTLELANADLVYAIKLVAKASQTEFACAPEVAGSVTLTGTFQPQGALNKIMEGTKFDWAVERGAMVVADSERVVPVLANFDKNLTALSEAPVTTVSLDFVNADLAYVCKILAREMKLTVAENPVKGSVTCQYHSRRTAETVAMVCALQNVEVSLSEGALYFK